MPQYENTLCSDLSQEFILDTNAIAFCVGALLSEIEDIKEQVVAYLSKLLSKPERYSFVTSRELPNVVEVIKHFHYFLYG